MMVDPGETKIFKRHMTQAGDGFIGRDRAAADCFQKFTDACGIHENSDYTGRDFYRKGREERKEAVCSFEQGKFGAKQSELVIEAPHIEKALTEIEQKRNVPRNRRSTGFCLIQDKRHYLPKYVLSRAHYHKTGKERRHFKSGPQTNTLLRDAGDAIKQCKSQLNCQAWLV